jgi:hypothetical protein
MTPADLAAKGLRVKPLVWHPNADYRVDGIIAGDFSGWWTCHRSDDLKTFEWSNPYGKTTYGFASQADAIAALEAERSARVAEMIEATE